MLKKVVFLDRDGTINQDSADYIKSWPEFTFLPRSIEALRDLTAARFIIIVITNQSAIPRKLISLQELENIDSGQTQLRIGNQLLGQTVDKGHPFMVCVSGNSRQLPIITSWQILQHIPGSRSNNELVVDDPFSNR